MALPWPLVWLIDPAEAYWRRRTPTPHGPVFHRGAVFGPDVPGGSRQATDEELVETESQARPDLEADDQRLDDLVRRRGDELRELAQRLLAEGAVSWSSDGRRVDARLVRFWRGDALLETAIRGPDGEGSSRTRIGRRPEEDELVQHLAQAVMEG